MYICTNVHMYVCSTYIHTHTTKKVLMNELKYNKNLAAYIIISLNSPTATNRMVSTVCD